MYSADRLRQRQWWRGAALNRQRAGNHSADQLAAEQASYWRTPALWISCATNSANCRVPATLQPGSLKSPVLQTARQRARTESSPNRAAEPRPKLCRILIASGNNLPTGLAVTVSAPTQA